MTDKRIKSYLEDRFEKLENIKKEREWTTSELGDIACCKQTLTYIDSLQEEPVSEDLEEAIANEWKGYIDRGAATVDALEDNTQELAFAKGFYRGTNWQKEQFEKNRLKHCNSITNEQAELEQGFIDQHLDEHQRMPTFLDAIEYGMEKMKEQMMGKAIDGNITFDYYGDDDKTYGCIAHDSFCLEDFGLKDRDKVKMILIKED